MNTKVAKKNNKGFTLIELIVVIAIIAVLAAILAPQYLRYVEKSRESADVQAAVEIINASKTAAADEKVYNFIKDKGATVEWKNDGTITATLPGDTANPNALQDELNKTIEKAQPKSKKYTAGIKFTMGYDSNTEMIKVTITSTNASEWIKNEALKNYAATPAS